MTDDKQIIISKKVFQNGLLQFRKYDKFLRNNLKNNEITFGSVNTLNDPFDCNLPIKLGSLQEYELLLLKIGATDRHFIETRAKELHDDPKKTEADFRRLIYDQRRFSCFTASNKSHMCNSLFWAHYADKHQGVCLKYNYTLIDYYLNLHETHVIPVEYCRTKKFPEFNYIQNRLNGHEKLASKYFFGTKSKEWKDEDELRFVYFSNKPIQEKYIKLKFEPTCLDAIYLGYNFDKNKISQIRKYLSAPKYKHIKLFSLELNKQRFIFNPISV